VLRFYALWDDTDSLYGDQLHFKIHYYLVDDTMEVVPVWERNGLVVVLLVVLAVVVIAVVVVVIAVVVVVVVVVI